MRRAPRSYWPDFFAIVWRLVLVSFIAFVGWKVWQSRTIAEDNLASGRLTNCANNMRKISLALTQYASLNAGVYPERLQEAAPYLERGFSFRCPELVYANPNSSNDLIDYNYLAAGLRAPLLPDCVLLSDRVTNHDHDGSSVNVLYADGRVEFITHESGRNTFFTMVKSTSRPVIFKND